MDAPLVRRSLEIVFRRSDGVIPFVLRTAAFAWFATAIVLLSIDLVHSLPELDDPVRSVAFEVFVGWIATVAIENLAMVLVIGIIDPSQKRWVTTVIVVAILSGVLHATFVSWRAIAGTILFAIMAHSYLLWRDATFKRRFLITVSQHLLFNLPATIGRLFET